MTIPTPAEVTAALAVLRASGAEGDDTIDAIANRVSPLRRMAFDLRNRIQRTDPDQLSALQVDTIHHLLTTLADSHGLRITTDLGEPIGYAIVENDNTEVASYRVYSRADLEEARANAAKRRGGVVVALLPEGGQQ